MPVILHALGDENALGFSVAFDPALLDFSGATAGTGAAGASFNLNAAAAGQGKVGVVVAQSPGDLFAAGTQQVAVLQFAIRPGSHQPRRRLHSATPLWSREVSDAAANVLSTSYIDGQLAINPLPVLRIGQQGASVVISWPASSGAFLLQSAETLSAASWDAVALDSCDQRIPGNRHRPGYERPQVLSAAREVMALSCRALAQCGNSSFWLR